VWYSDGGKGSVIVSDTLQHFKQTVFVFMEFVLKEVMAHGSGIKSVQIFSDGAPTQFKQKYLFCSLTHWKEKFNIELVWNFFATSHGKGTVDGIGGTVKRSVMRAVRTGNQVKNAREFYHVAKIKNLNIDVHFITEAEIREMDEFTHTLWDGIITLPHTQSMHCIIPLSKYLIKASQVSNAPLEDVITFRHKSVDDELPDSNVELLIQSQNNSKVNMNESYV
jgi:hypothetical protein